MGIKDLFVSEDQILSIEISNSVKVIYGGRKKDNKITIKNVASDSLPQEAFQMGQLTNPSYLSDMLKNIIKSFKVKKAKALIAIPAQNVVVRFFNFPHMPENELREAIRWELDRYVPFSEEDINYDIQILDVYEKEGLKEYRIMLVAVPREVLSPYLEAIKDLNLIPTLIDVSIFSAVRSMVLSRKEFPPGNTLYLYSYDNVAEFVVAKGNQPMFFRSTIMEEWNPQEEGMDDLTKSFIIEDFVRKIQEAVNFFYMQFPEEHIDHMLVSGGNAKDRDFIDLLEAILNIPAEACPDSILNLDLNLNLKKKERSFLEDFHSWIVSIGLFLWEGM
ncbi:MAG TPA: pilus assembly protein PilM [Dictyoglomaceae bacterium]|nr:pilus assembly protein PilM [Dictyoglomaceae bacterium]HOL38788.1 pilus assembly protein PilM [Dictyoglomaceae bacterium]HOP94508.1 pilus assembly protein PilM [Dictyoglomaceae bacterium]HPP15463.1 pilus assembly protein PilM [Dictyoglomaceae bacterium]HPU43241.1 pilus assembly protein PilM [Dictyoglomaceae bacterium]